MHVKFSEQNIYQVDSQSLLQSRLPRNRLFRLFGLAQLKMELNRTKKVDLSRSIWSFPHPYVGSINCVVYDT